ncbi:beta-sandwich lipoprotein [Glutamicibacter ardleyensis]|uniref:beta-sandwich lipoprotein n=1 Tax=Glutamicibacter ardleyensis TaxID=225894 RepID=UPI003FD58FE3
MKKKSIIAMSALTIGALALAGCTNADVASRNLSKEADHFEVQRHIVGVNGITNDFAFEVVGRCSIADHGHQLEVTCKHGPDEYRKHIIGLSDNTFYVAEQMESIDVSVYHTKVIVKPETLIPEIELQTGKQ